MKLYYSPGACSMAAHILMHEWNVPHTAIRVDLKTHQTEQAQDFYKINPKGYVPALEMDNGQLLTENIAILFYLSDLKGSVKGDKYKYLEWLAFISTELHKGLGSLFGFKEPETVKFIKERAAKRLKLIDEHLGAQEYVFENSFSAADAYLVTVLNWCKTLQVDLTPYNNINAYMKKMLARPSVVKAMQHEGLVK